MFLAPGFAIAGLAAAAGPVIIHLLNRRRFRVLDWAAMDFLKEAMFRSRRMMELRDLLLMALRMLCIVGFGLAMARPCFQTSAAAANPGQPLHAVLVIDNSLSMSYSQLNGKLLDDAKNKAKELIKDNTLVPRGSRISVLPACGSAREFSYNAYYTVEDAQEAVDAIEVVDRAAKGDETIDLAFEACRRVPEMPSKSIYFFTDQQIANWPIKELDEHLKQLPSPMQKIEVGQPEEVENAWISDFKIKDGVADLMSPATFVATIEYEGEYARPSVQVTLIVEGQTIAVQTVELQPGQKREVEFPPYSFRVSTEPGKPTFVPAEISLSPEDNLPDDDRRCLVIPVVATLPVVFVDQWGDNESPRLNQYGETWNLRRLLVPVTGAAERDRQFVEIRHVRIEQLSRSLLEDARLVVIAGVSSPADKVELLQEYVQQGGKLMISAGGNFDPALWTSAAWKDGGGILPAPLEPEVVEGLAWHERAGKTDARTGGEIDYDQLDSNSMENHDYFLPEGTSPDQLKQLYAKPYFFKAVKATVDEETKEATVRAVAKDIEQGRTMVAEIDEKLAELDELERKDKLSKADRDRRARLVEQRAVRKPNWLLWTSPQDDENDQRPADEIARTAIPNVLASFTNGMPFLIERRHGRRGQVLLLTSGITRDWNTLSITPTVFIYDRIMRSMLTETLPERNLSSQQQFVLPVTAAERRARFMLTHPNRQETLLEVDALGTDRYGIAISNLTRRGHYKVTAYRTRESTEEGLEPKLWEVPLAVNGPPEESQLISAKELQQRQTRGQAEFDDPGQRSSGEGIQRAQLHGTDIWKWVMLAVLGCLLLELVFLAWPSATEERRG